MIILGIDPGSIATGWGVVESDPLKAVAWDTLKPPSKLSGKAGLPQRLFYIYEGLRLVVFEYEPDIVAIERGFSGANLRTAYVMGETLGAILMAVKSCKTANYSGPKIFEYAPKTIKKVVAGRGDASKGVVYQAVFNHLYYPEQKMTGGDGWEIAHKWDEVDYDITDALATALCHVLTEGK